MAWGRVYYRTPEGLIPSADALVCSEVSDGQDAFIFVTDAATGQLSHLMRLSSSRGHTLTLDTDDSDSTPSGTAEIACYLLVGDPSTSGTEFITYPTATLSAAAPQITLDFRCTLLLDMTVAGTGTTGMLRISG
jgi:hypothetical protein